MSQKTTTLSLGLTVILLTLSLGSQAQIGGQHAFASSSLPTNARVTALGGSLITIGEDDVALAQMNPAVTDSLMSGQIAINHNFHFAGISHGNLAYGKYLHKYKLATHIGLQYVNFGSFTESDAFDNILGEFSAGEVSLIAGAARQLNERIRGGINLKVLTASYYSQKAIGLGMDAGITYQNPASASTWALVFRNIGGEIEPLVDDRRSLPFDVQLGMSRRLAHLPFRFSIIAHHLHKLYIRYDDPSVDIQSSFTGEVTQKSNLVKNIDNLFRHVTLNGEFLIGKREQFRLRFGYDHLRRQELKATTFRSRGGFTFGVGFNIKKIKIDYGVGNYHLAGATNHLSIRYDLGRFSSKV